MRWSTPGQYLGGGDGSPSHAAVQVAMPGGRAWHQGVFHMVAVQTHAPASALRPFWGVVMGLRRFSVSFGKPCCEILARSHIMR